MKHWPSENYVYFNNQEGKEKDTYSNCKRLKVDLVKQQAFAFS